MDDDKPPIAKLRHDSKQDEAHRERQRLGMTLSPETRELLDMFASADGVSISRVVDDLVQAENERRRGRPVAEDPVSLSPIIEALVEAERQLRKKRH